MNKPHGELVIQTLAMPCTTNPNGDIFGGWLVSQMDLAGGVLAKRITQGRVVTVAIDSMSFKKPVHVGNLVCCYASLVSSGNTSVTIDIEVWTETLTTQEEKIKVTEGRFIFVAIDEHRNPRPFVKSI
ncbi:MAG: acyl-CoA thioesterase [Legionellaceae bacterium]|nr:acyl-CoA thioesterase [Legionellaceae bacterium]